MYKILIIEHNNLVKEHVANVLQLASYHVFAAGDGKRGVEMAIDNKPDLIICGIDLPIIDGHGVLHMVSRNAVLEHIPFIFLSDKLEWREMRQGIEQGADDYIIRPVDSTELLNIVEQHLRKAAVIRHRFNGNAIMPGRTKSVNSLRDYIGELKQNGSIHKYKKKQEVYFEGNHPSAMYFVVRGRVKEYKRNEDGKELILGLYGEGEFFGYTALLEKKCYTESAEALEDTELAVVPASEFEKLLNDNPYVMKKVIELLARDIKEKEQKLLNLAYNSLRKKVADTLVALYQKYKEENQESFYIDLTRENLAAIAGVAKESLTRTLSEFRQESLIALTHSRIQILNYKKLEQMNN